MRELGPGVGIIGGSGLYEMEGLESVREVQVETPFGAPSDPPRVGTLDGRPVAFLARHGAGHRLLPTEINYRANVWALKSLGVERVLSVSAVGSLAEEIHPRHVVLPDQFIDRTRHRPDTFFGEGIVAHVSLADPICRELAASTARAVTATGTPCHEGGAYLCMEGPQFSTRAESRTYRAWGATVIGMTNLQEARLCREAELCYATIALVTDYDSWRETGEEAVVGEILENLRHGVDTAASALRGLIPALPAERSCPCRSALEGAILTRRDSIPEATRRRLGLLVERYL